MSLHVGEQVYALETRIGNRNALDRAEVLGDLIVNVPCRQPVVHCTAHPRLLLFAILDGKRFEIPNPWSKDCVHAIKIVDEPRIELGTL